MAEQTGIEWTDHTFNPWWGCEKVSPGCAHCYAEGVSIRYEGPGLWGAGHRFRFFGDKHWAEPLRWNARAEREGVRRRVFCASMADVFEERDELVASRHSLFDLISVTPYLDWQVLTKRPEFARDWLRHSYYIGERELTTPLPNVWLGVSIENARHTWRADVLRQIPAAVRFISAEPLLGSLYADEAAHDEARKAYARGETRSDGGGGSGLADAAASMAAEPNRTAHAKPPRRAPLDLTGIDWVIVGGESGPGARPMRLEWAREIVRAATDPHGGHGDNFTAVFVKQLGAKPHESGVSMRLLDAYGPTSTIKNPKGGDMSEWPADLRIREFPASAAVPV